MSRTYTKRVDDELVKVDTGELEYIWGDGRHGNRPTYLYRKNEDVFIKENVNNWQGERSKIKIWDKEQAVSFLKKQTQHSTRQLKALDELGVEVKEL